MYLINNFKIAFFMWIFVFISGYQKQAGCGDKTNQADKLSSRNWASLAPIPQPIFGSCAVVFHNKLHILGGGTNNGCSSAHQVYDPGTDSWELKAALPDPGGRGWGQPSLYKEKIYLFGGCDKDWVGSATAWVYDPFADKWTDLSDMPVKRFNGGAVTVGNYIYIFGGHTGENNGIRGPRTFKEQLKSLYRYDPAYDTYTRLSDAPETMNFINYTHYKGSIYAISGCEHEKYVPGPDGDTYYSFGQGVLRYDVARDTWTKISTPRMQRTWTLTQCSPFASFGSKIFIVGGRPTTLTRLALAEYYDIEEDRFVRIPDLPYTRCCGSGAVINGVLYVTGGFYGPEGDIKAVVKETLAIKISN